MCITSPSFTMYSLPSSRRVPAVAGFGFGASFQQLVPVDGLGADEMMLQIGVDRPRRVPRLFEPSLDGPGPALIFADSEEMR